MKQLWLLHNQHIQSRNNSPPFLKSLRSQRWSRQVYLLRNSRVFPTQKPPAAHKPGAEQDAGPSHGSVPPPPTLGGARRGAATVHEPRPRTSARALRQWSPTHPSSQPPTHPSLHPPTHPSLHLHIHPSIPPSTHPLLHPPITLVSSPCSRSQTGTSTRRGRAHQPRLARQGPGAEPSSTAGPTTAAPNQAEQQGTGSPSRQRVRKRCLKF